MILSRKVCLSVVGLTLGGALGFYILRRLKKKSKSLKPSSIILVTNNEEWEKAWEKLSQDLKTFPVLGIDCEWVTQGNKRNPVSLVQLSSTSGTCVLVRTQLFLRNESSFPSTFKDLLSDKRILKVGVAPVEDGEKLTKDFHLKCFGFLDLRNFVMRCTKLNYKPAGLKRMAKEILDTDLDKNYKVRCGNWEGEELNDSQILYAALDSLVSLRMFISLLEKNFGLDEQHFVSSDGINGSCPKQSVLATCQGMVDLKFTPIKNTANSKSKQTSRKERLVKEVKTSRAYEVRKSPLYHGSKLYSTDCQLLCTCDVKKAQWYLDKNLGEKMSDDPLCVRLLFEPTGRPTSQKDYYLQEKDNLCVVCGKQDSYMRKFIIPHEYKRHLPAISKEHKSHDVVLMCVPCHLLSDQLDLPIKGKLADKYNAKIRCDKYLSQSNVAKVKSSAQALSRNKLNNKIPTARVEELEQILLEHFKVDAVTDEIIQKGLDLAKEREENKEYEEHGKKVMEAILAEGKLDEFEVLWRHHFLTSMNPQFMPLQWSVNHGHNELRPSLDIDTTDDDTTSF